MNGGELVQLEVTEDDEEAEDDSDSNEGGDQTDEDEDEEGPGDDNYGYVWNIVSGSLGGHKYSIIVFI